MSVRASRLLVAVEIAFAALVLLLFWAPWLDDGEVSARLLEEKGVVDGTVRNGTVVCEYKVRWAPFGRVALSCEGGPYYVTFWGQVLP
ncbi:hypothetical protein [Thermofilum pendens]|uniref:Uncharacterized protein n=1 Tax=Thermofilum pendens (strain DSM 2475 / Hrk 5) TaxID=368408 RepID=A1RYU0_THEPD|nr:hypothetical protein [Thermofilum pendens]ABL78370.1 hypothetical protein Tpen_0970 [Thermofilum pendens Hrk 5]